MSIEQNSIGRRTRKSEMQKTTRTVVDAASRCFREKGLSGATLADIMTSVGLTTGGFYRHFSSKDELTEIALEDNLLDVIADCQRRAFAPEQTIDAICDWALAPVDDITRSAAAAFAPEISRQSVSIQEAFTKHTADRIAAIASCLPRGDEGSALNHASAIYSMLVGAAQLSRFHPETGPAVRDMVLNMSGCKGSLELDALRQTDGKLAS
ncbi:TetR/AcrR family transcriptional regulator [Rhizobium sp. Rhizsp42]|uniref:TetR/AcrR family transcriptional regulator n=1 Tax=Rhizobium sp. Rhizsp42 TaxID=3243034 RepID=UPI0013AE99B3